MWRCAPAYSCTARGHVCSGTGIQGGGQACAVCGGNSECAHCIDGVMERVSADPAARRLRLVSTDINAHGVPTIPF